EATVSSHPWQRLGGKGAAGLEARNLVLGQAQDITQDVVVAFPEAGCGGALRALCRLGMERQTRMTMAAGGGMVEFGKEATMGEIDRGCQIGRRHHRMGGDAQHLQL